MTKKRHRHTWTSLYSRFGPHGDQTKHYHVCFDEDCGAILVGPNRDGTDRPACDGDRKSHKVVR